MENDTIEQLDSAVAKLMDAYESLQAQYKDLEDKNQELENTINELQSEKNSLESNIDNLSDNKNKQSNHMNSLFNKIESMLTSNPLKSKSEEIVKPEIIEIDEEIDNHTDTDRKEDIKDLDIILQNNDTVDIDTTQNTNGNPKKIDMSRMESLLNGM